MDPDRRCALYAEHQEGLFHRIQALAAGHNDDTIRYRLHTRRWARYHRSVYRMRGAQNSPLQRYKGATLWAGELVEGRLVAISGLSAAALHGFPLIVPRTLEVVTTARLNSPPPGLKVYSRSALEPAHVIDIDGIPVTGVAWTLAEIAGVVSGERLQRIVEDLVRRERLNPSAQVQLLDSPTFRRRPGRARLRRILNDLDPRLPLSQSGLQMEVYDMLVGGGLPAPVLEYPVTLSDGVLVHIDLGYPLIRFGIEADGYDPHADRQAWEWDRYKDLMLAEQGWTIVRVTSRQMRGRKSELMRSIRSRYLSLGGSLAD